MSVTFRWICKCGQRSAELGICIAITSVGGVGLKCIYHLAHTHTHTHTHTQKLVLCYSTVLVNAYCCLRLSSLIIFSHIHCKQKTNCVLPENVLAKCLHCCSLSRRTQECVCLLHMYRGGMMMRMVLWGAVWLHQRGWTWLRSSPWLAECACSARWLHKQSGI